MKSKEEINTKLQQIEQFLKSEPALSDNADCMLRGALASLRWILNTEETIFNSFSTQSSAAQTP